MVGRLDADLRREKQLGNFERIDVGLVLISQGDELRFVIQERLPRLSDVQQFCQIGSGDRVGLLLSEDGLSREIAPVAANGIFLIANQPLLLQEPDERRVVSAWSGSSAAATARDGDATEARRA